MATVNSPIAPEQFVKYAIPMKRLHFS
jgi:hypothetical protein